jgi:oligopeptide/dipeptide ABC transporter ATP-binding protein
MRRVRGRRIGFVFQEPAAALNPVMSCGAQVMEAVRARGPFSRRDAWERAVEAMRQAGIPGPGERARAYPHELSGGLRQRVMLAIALASEPDLLIADEPTAALDVTIQVQILDLLRRLRAERSLSLLLITHDLAVAAEIADEVAVMYAGRIVESGPASGVLSRPRHPYTWGLMNASPRASRDSRGALRAIPGSVPRPGEIGRGCRFEPRCLLREPECAAAEPSLAPGPRSEHRARCWFSERLKTDGLED